MSRPHLRLHWRTCACRHYSPSEPQSKSGAPGGDRGGINKKNIVIIYDGDYLAALQATVAVNEIYFFSPCWHSEFFTHHNNDPSIRIFPLRRASASVIIIIIVFYHSVFFFTAARHRQLHANSLNKRARAVVD